MEHAHPNGYRSADILCPFYKSYADRRIRCEGFTDHSVETTVFRSMWRFEQFLERYCCGAYVTCPKYRAIMEEKYKDTGK